MYEFGDNTNSQREEISRQEILSRSSNATTDDLKNHYQLSTAIVLSMVEIDKTLATDQILGLNADETFKYIVLLEREQRQILASHIPNNSIWSISSYPRPGDRVEIKHKRDFFQAEITKKISASLLDAIAKYGAITKTAG